MKPNQNLLQH